MEPAQAAAVQRDQDASVSSAHAEATASAQPAATVVPVGPDNPDADVEWRDVTEQLSAAAARLSQEEMVHVETFSLHDNLTAHELMDPRLDSGSRFRSMLAASMRVEAGGVPALDSLRDMVAVMDALSIQHVLYLRGHALPRTVGACLPCHPAVWGLLRERGHAAAMEAAYAGGVETAHLASVEHDRQSVLSFVLSAFVASYMRLVDCERRIILNGDVHEEDDFSTGLHKVKLHKFSTALTTQQVLRGAKVAETLLKARRAALLQPELLAHAPAARSAATNGARAASGDSPPAAEAAADDAAASGGGGGGGGGGGKRKNRRKKGKGKRDVDTAAGADEPAEAAAGAATASAAATDAADGSATGSPMWCLLRAGAATAQVQLLPVGAEVGEEADLCQAALQHLSLLRALHGANLQLESATSGGIRAASALLKTADSLLASMAERVGAAAAQASVAAAEGAWVEEGLGLALSDPTPLHFIHTLTAAQAVEWLRKCVGDMLAVCDAAAASVTLPGGLAALDVLHARRAQLLARSHAAQMLFVDEKLMGVRPLADLIRDDLQRFGCSEERLCTAPSKAFLQEALKPVYDVLRLRCMQPARQWRSLSKVLELWVALRNSAEWLDQAAASEANEPMPTSGEFPPRAFAWAMNWILREMRRGTELCTALELAQEAEETRWLLWYKQLLLGYRMQCLRMLCEPVEMEVPDKRAAKAGKKKGGKRGAAPAASKQVVMQRVPSPLSTREQMEDQLQWLMCRGMTQLLGAVLKCELVADAVKAFDNPALRFVRRLYAFRSVDASLLPAYDDFVLMTQRAEPEDPVEAATQAVDWLQQAKRLAEQLVQALQATRQHMHSHSHEHGCCGGADPDDEAREEALRQLGKVLAANTVCVMQLKQANALTGNPNGLRCVLDWRTCDQCPVLRVQRQEAAQG